MNTNPPKRKEEILLNFYRYPKEYQYKVKKIWSNKVFIFTVIIPTFLAIFYYTFIASNIYISESRFIVRAQSTKDGLASISSGGLGGMLGTLGGISTSNNDSLTADNYISSRDALKALNEGLHIKDAFSSTTIDLLHRYGGMRFWDKSLESFFDYYIDKIITIENDSDSGISTLTVRAYTPELSFQINSKLNELSEELINRLNDRARYDTLGFSEQEVEQAKKKVEEINQKIYDFRSHSMTGAVSANNQITLYQQMLSEKNSADSNLAASLDAMQQARIESMKKRLYLERVTRPNLPDYAVEPKRLKGIFSIFILGLTIFGIASMLITGVKEHGR